MNFKSILIKINSLVYRLQFKTYGSKSIIVSPLKLDCRENIKIGNNVIINYKSWLAAVPLTGNKAELIIGDGTVIGNFAHIYATRSIYIGKKVLMADKVYISDNLHGYEYIDTPIIDQPIIQKKEVSIGDGSWIGEHVCIIGASIGRHCVIGANSVVTKDIPDYCVAVGNPARVIKKYSFEQNTWIKC